MPLTFLPSACVYVRACVCACVREAEAFLLNDWRTRCREHILLLEVRRCVFSDKKGIVLGRLSAVLQVRVASGDTDAASWSVVALTSFHGQAVSPVLGPVQGQHRPYLFHGLSHLRSLQHLLLLSAPFMTFAVLRRTGRCFCTVSISDICLVFPHN